MNTREDRWPLLVVAVALMALTGFCFYEAVKNDSVWPALAAGLLIFVGTACAVEASNRFTAK